MATTAEKVGEIIFKDNHFEFATKHERKIEKIIKERVDILRKAQNSLEFRVACIERCRQDTIFFCNYFVATFDPREEPSMLPFILFPRQEELVKWVEQCIDNKRWGTLVKSRDTGASFILMMVALHRFLFRRDFSCSVASNKKDLVDLRGSDETLFYKIDSMMESLPFWMRPSVERKAMLLRNPANNSVIKGQSGTNIGRGGRSNFVIVDEAAFIEADDKMIKALSRNTDCAILLSTPDGKDNQFYLMTTREAIAHFWYRWEADPRRSPLWRARQTEMFGEEVTAQELDCDFDASSKGSFIKPKWINACVNAHHKIERLAEASKIKQAGLDVATFGKNDTILTIRNGYVVDSIESYPANYPTQTALLVNQQINDLVDFLCFDGDGVGIDIAGAIDNLDEYPSYALIEFHGNAKAGDRQVIGQDKYTAKDLYFNARADAWGGIRERIKSTYEHVTGIAQHNLNELISIPDDEQLKLELSMPKWKFKGNKILIESKQEMKDRGLPSPDKADSLVYAFYEDNETANWILRL